MAKILQFAHTEGTLRRRVARECDRADQEMMDRAAWMYQFSAGFQDPLPLTEEERQMMEEGLWES